MLYLFVYLLCTVLDNFSYGQLPWLEDNDVISSSWWLIHFWVKMHVFQLFSTVKVKLADEIMQSNYLCAIFHVKCKKISIFTVFTSFLILDKIQDGVWWHQRPPAAPPPIKYTSSCREDQRLSTEGKIVSKYCNISKTQGGVHQPPLVPLWGYEFACMSQG